MTATGRRCPRPGASSAKPCTSSPTSVTTRSPSPDSQPRRPQWPPGDAPGMWTWTGKPSPRWGINRGQLPPIRCQTASPPPHRRRGRPYETERPHPRRAGVTQSIIMSRATCPKAIGKPGWPHPTPRTHQGPEHPPPEEPPPPHTNTASRQPPHPRRLIIRPQPAASRAPTASLRDRARAALDPGHPQAVHSTHRGQGGK
jgi:hypothetical protein